MGDRFEITRPDAPGTPSEDIEDAEFVEVGAEQDGNGGPPPSVAGPASVPVNPRGRIHRAAAFAGKVFGGLILLWLATTLVLGGAPRTICSAKRITAFFFSNAPGDPCSDSSKSDATAVSGTADGSVEPDAPIDIGTGDADAPTGVQAAVNQATPMDAMLADWLIGSWVLAPKGGEDGRTDCGQFNAPTLYRLNGNTALIMTFSAEGKYRSMFAYTTPSGAEHYTIFKAKWEVAGGNLRTTDTTAHDAFDVNRGSSSQAVSRAGDNVLVLPGDGAISGGRFVRCAGATDDIYGE